MKKKKNSRSSLVNAELEKKRLAALSGHHLVAFKRLFTDEEIHKLRTLIDEEHSPAQVSHEGGLNSEIRRSKVRFVPGDEYKWVYDRLWIAAKEVNKLYKFNISGIKEGIQIAMYDESEEGFYRWHKDTSVSCMHRKISLSVPLSDPSEYEGGELQFMLGSPHDPTVPTQTKGHAICFPSHELHRVTPVTKGRRYSIVAWIGGPDWA